jgi:hypothetical protein
VYADATFYTESYFGKLIPADDLDSYLTKASDAVDQLTLYRITQKGGIDQLTVFQQRQVKLAVCAQADFKYGLQEMPDWVQSYSVGSVSVSKNDKTSTEYSSAATQYLRPTNLMYRGLGS